MNNEDLNQIESDELAATMAEFFGKGGAFKDLKGMSDEAMEAIYSVAYNLYQGGKYEEAQKVFQFLCFYDHFNRKYFMGLGACQQMMKQYEQAIEIFSFVTVLDSDDPRPLIYVGDCYIAMGEKDNARYAYETALEWAEDNGEFAEERTRAETMLNNLKQE